MCYSLMVHSFHKAMYDVNYNSYESIATLFLQNLHESDVPRVANLSKRSSTEAHISSDPTTLHHYNACERQLYSLKNTIYVTSTACTEATRGSRRTKTEEEGTSARL